MRWESVQRPARYDGPALELPGDHPRSPSQALCRAAERFPRSGTVAVSAHGPAEFVSYPELLDRSRRVLAGLRRHGLGAGDHVVVYSSEPLHFVTMFWACALGGLRPLLVARPTDQAAGAAVRDRLRHAARLLGGPTILCDEAAPAELPGDLVVLDVTSHAGLPPATDAHQAGPDDVAVLMMSSGSTGAPKLIQLTVRGLAEFAAGTPALLPVRPGDTTLNWLPLDHSGAFLLYHLLEVFVGATNVHAPTEMVLADPLSWLDLISAHRVNHTWSPNFGYQLVNDALVDEALTRGSDARRRDLSSITTLVSGGEQITVPVMTEFLRATAPFGIRPEAFVPAWGMTETVTAISFARPGLVPNIHRARRSGTDGALVWVDETADPDDCVSFVAVGAPAPGASLRVVDDDNAVLPEGHVGRLQVCSARVTPGYFGNPAATRAAFVSDDAEPRVWLDTGDLAFGADGQIVIAGRRDDRIILHGQNHYAHDIETLVADVAGVVPGAVAAVGVPSGTTGTEELVVFFGTDSAESDDTVRKIRQALFTRSRLTARVVAVPIAAFPKTPSGKIQRSVLRQRFIDGDGLTGTAPPDTGRAAGSDTGRAAGSDTGRAAGPTRVSVGPADAVRGAFHAVLGSRADDHVPFHELGIDSVTLVRLHARLQHDLGLTFSKLAMFEHPSIAALTRHLGTLDAAPARRPRPAAEPGAEQRIAIVGMAARFPGAATLDEFWANLTAGVVSVRRFDSDELASAGVSADDDLVPVTGALSDIDAFDAEFFGMSAAEAEVTDPGHRLFLECCYHALEHGGYAGATGGERIGVFAGSGMNLYTHQNYLLNNLHGARTDAIGDIQTAIGTQPDFLATRVAYRLGLTGPAIGVQTACSTSLVAVHLACQALRTGDADLALAGAAAVHVPQVTGYRPYPGSILSPSGRCRAFDADADGTVGGNGVAAVLLKRLDRALADGDTIHAVILGSAVNNDGRGKVGFTAPSVAGQVDVIEQALDRAGVPADSISYLEAHGTGTPLGDPVELRAAARALRGRTDRVGFCTVGSVKPNIGHLDSCAGMAGLIKTVLMLSHRTLVPLANLRRPNPELELDGSPFVLGDNLRRWDTDGTPRRAGVSALGVGGTNAHLILEEAPTRPACEHVPPVLRVLPLSAPHPQALAELISRTRDHLRAYPGLPVPDLITTAALGRPHHRHRVAVVGDSTAELAEALGAASAGAAPATGPVAVTFAFTGQGAARPGMVGELYDAFPAFRRVLDECEAVYAEQRDASLLALLRQPADQRVWPTDQQVWPTDTAQPALFAYQVALAELWRSLGVEPAFLLGHSVGEYAALRVAGALSTVDGLRLTMARGALMRHEAPPGAMVAVLADRAVVDELVGGADELEGGARLDIAAVNGPQEYVLAGSESAIAEATTRLDHQAVGWRRLPVDRAFHSAELAPIIASFAERAAAVRLSPLRIPVASTVTGRLLAPGTVLDADHLVRQISQPVLFADALAGLVAQGCQHVLEIGPDAVLSAIGRRTSPDTIWVPAQRQGTHPVRATEQAVAQLYRHGCEPDWTAVAGGGARVPLPSYPFQRRRYWIDRNHRDVPAGAPVDAPADVRADAPGEAPAPATSSTVGPPETGGPRSAVLATIRDLTARQLGAVPAEVRPDRTFLDLGADSLTMLRVVREVRQSFGVALAARELFTEADTPGRLSTLVTERMAGVDAEVAVPHSVTASAAPAAPAPPAPAAPAPLAAAGPVSPAPAATVPSPRATAPPAAPTPYADAATCDFSLYFFGSYPDQSGQDKYGAILEAARFGDEHGFHGVWFPERHFHAFGGLFPNPVVLAAAVARETTRIRINAGSVVLPLHDPIRVAEEWSVVDNLSGGRVGLCVASGWHANDFALRPEAYGRHRELMYEHLETVRALWTGDPVTVRSGSGDPVDVRIYPRPLQDMPPMFVAAVSNPETYRSAATRGLGVVTNLMMQSIEQLADNVALYRRTRQEHGLDPDGGRVVVLVHTYLAGDLRRARTEAFRPFCDYLRSSLSLLGGVANSLGLRIEQDTPADDVEFLLERAYARYCEERALIGTVDSTASIVNRLVSAGVDEIACFVDFGVTAEQMLRSLHLVDQARTRHQRPEPGRPHAPLSPAQRGMWFVEKMSPGRPIYHEPKAIRLTGPLDVAALRAALAAVIDRHPALRTVIRDVDGEPRQLVLPSVPVECPVLDSPVLDSPDAPVPETVRRAVADLNATRIDLAAGPLLRMRLVRLGPDDHVLVLVAHHIVFDSFSTAVLVRDLAAHYRSWPARPPALAALPVSFLDHVRERLAAGDERRRHLDYWRSVLSDAPTLRLPTDRPRPAVPTGRGASLVHDLDADLTSTLQRFCRRHRVTPFMTLLGAVAAVLGRFSGQDDVVLGTVLTNRPPGTENVIGLFIDSVPLRVDLSGTPTFDQVVRRVRDTSTEAFDHAGVGFDEVVGAVNPERDPSRNPIFQVLVEYETATAVEFDPPTVDATLLDVPSDRAPLDLTLYLVHHADRVECVVEYSTDLFDEESVRRLLQYVETVLRRGCAAPDLGLPALTAPTDQDRDTISRWSGAYRDTPPDCLHELVERQVARTPGGTALVDGAAEVSYRELDRRANAVAWQLCDRGVRADELVAVCLPRGVDLIAVLLGVHKAGAAYLPLDRSLPDSRLSFMVGDSGAVLLVTDDEKLGPLVGVPALAVTSADPRAHRPPPTRAGPDNLAYCIYTSGSTGRPKGVAVPHRGPANLVRAYLRHRPALRTLQWTSVGFDVSVQEIFTALASGAALVLIPDEDRYEPEAVAATVRRHRVQRLFMPFTPLKYLMTTAPVMPSLRELVSAGEELTLTPALRRFLAAHPDCVLYNEYGPTEASIIATIGRVDPAAGDKPAIGRPVDNVVVRLLDAAGRPVPLGAVGEIHLGGAGLAQGYVGRPEETANAFVPDPTTPTARLYRTRDLGRWLPDGTLRYVGRADDQIKIRGYRVEPEEAQRALLELEEVRDAAVLAARDPRGDTCLVGYLVLADDVPAGFVAGLAARLTVTLPAYLVPACFVEVDELPVGTSGKLDRRRLPAPAWSDQAGDAPATDLERALHELWAAQLDVARVPVDASFFSLGGHSLSAVELVHRIRARLGVELRVTDLFTSPTIASLARRIAATAGTAPDTAVAAASDTPAATAPDAASGIVSDTAPATSIQRRAWRLHHTNPRPAVYNVVHRIRLAGDLDVIALTEALRALVDRHAALRTRFVSADGQLRQEVLADVRVELSVEDLPGEPEREDRWSQDVAAQVFALDRAPLWRVRLARVGERRWVLVLVLHHLICDGWSMGVLWRELSSLYTDTVAGTRTELPAVLGYPDYARWRVAQLDGARRDALVAFWRTELADAPLRVALPVDRPRQGELSGRGRLHRFEIPEQVVRVVQDTARAIDSTPAAVLTGAFAVWLAGLCGQNDLVIPLSSANRLHPEHVGVVGPVGEALPVRVTLAASMPFDDVVRAVTERTLAALDHHALALGQVAEALGTALPTPQVLFTVVTTPPPALDLPGVVSEVEGLPVAGVARTELYVVLVPAGDRIEAVFEYSTDLFDAHTIGGWAEDFVAVLSRVAGAPHDEIGTGAGPR